MGLFDEPFEKHRLNALQIPECINIQNHKLHQNQSFPCQRRQTAFDTNSWERSYGSGILKERTLPTGWSSGWGPGKEWQLRSAGAEARGVLILLSRWTRQLCTHTFSSKFMSIDLFYFMHMSVLPMCASRMPGAPRAQKRLLDPLELELIMVVGHNVSAGKEGGSSARTSHLNCWAIFPAHLLTNSKPS